MEPTIYYRPIRALLKEMISALGLKPGQVFTTARVTQWFLHEYKQSVTVARVPKLDLRR